MGERDDRRKSEGLNKEIPGRYTAALLSECAPEITLLRSSRSTPSGSTYIYALGGGESLE